MKKTALLIFSILMISCGEDKEVLLPVAKETIVAEVKDHSPIYFFFKLEEKDTIVDVNRNNSISSTNWLFNIDKRLPLRKVILEIKKLQIKKDKSAHKSATSENYFTYTDTVKKNLAFMPFTKIRYKLEKPDFNVKYFHLDRNDLVHYNELVFSKNQLQEFINKLPNPSRIYFSFDKGMSFGKYIEYKLFIKNLEITQLGVSVNSNKEYIY
ncbi:hypothetical protein IVB69_01375 [Flavobacterium sp. J49]|uniref:hypothetical protein n=1 Tax=Flavobacterium sp. J49 TaxID=2718534 RepID=UPI0015937D5E|nr:hypothetical protein [Flavobacterium sp. J49]MBF6640120.1 hypothetical protein [Flavobacterium sp. J49]NIC01365.1 hypothetical protein [Flavobacterium sp. J49]